MKNLQIFTDGACSGNPGRGGAAALIIYPNGEEKEVLYSEDMTTNQRMEIKAVIIAISEILKSPLPTENINIYSDSAYVCNCINQKWYKNWLNNGWRNSKKEPVKNKDLWESLLEGISILEEEHKINFIKVKGHSENVMNERVDKLAVFAREQRS